MNALRARGAIVQAQRVLERVAGKNKGDCAAIERVREYLATAERELQPDEPVPLDLPPNDGASAAQTRRKERFW